MKNIKCQKNNIIALSNSVLVLQNLMHAKMGERRVKGDFGKYFY